MTKEELSEEGINIEPFAKGFIIADYSGLVCVKRFCGQSMIWKQQPIIRDPFSTEEEAVAACKDF